MPIYPALEVISHAPADRLNEDAWLALGAGPLGETILAAAIDGATTRLTPPALQDYLDRQPQPLTPAAFAARFVRDSLARQIGARHLLLETHELDDPAYAANPTNRCYFCKTELYTELIELAQREGYPFILNGANADDVGDYRPGEQAAREFGVRAPLREAGFTKAHVRALARELGLPNWDKPAMACLSSRLPYGTPVTRAALSQVERAENYLRRLGFRQVRVRHHNDLARIEVERADLARLVELGPQIYAELKRLGYTYIAADLLGFRSGSLNEAIGQRTNGG